MTIPRFDGALAWANMPRGKQAEIGAIALELLVGIKAMQATEDAGKPGEPTDDPVNRAAHTAVANCLVLLDEAAGRAGRAFARFVCDKPSIPLSLGDICERCGCSESDPCAGPCSWVKPGLCSSCERLRYVPADARNAGLVS